MIRAFLMLLLLLVITAVMVAVSWGAEVKFTWNANPERDIAGYVILGGRSAGNWTITYPTGNVTTSTVSGLESSTLYYFTIKAVNTSGLESDEAAPITVTTRAAIPRLVREGWIVTASSHEVVKEDNRVTNAIDGNDQTMWHTMWSGSLSPHSIKIQIPKPAIISGLWYLPRQDGGTNGIIQSYEVETSLDGVAWSVAVKGQWPATAAEKYVALPLTEARFIRLWATGTHAAAAEIDLDGTYAPEPPATMTLTTQQSSDMQTWQDIDAHVIPVNESKFFRLKIEPTQTP